MLTKASHFLERSGRWNPNISTFRSWVMSTYSYFIRNKQPHNCSGLHWFTNGSRKTAFKKSFVVSTPSRGSKELWCKEPVFFFSLFWRSYMKYHIRTLSAVIRKVFSVSKKLVWKFLFLRLSQKKLTRFWLKADLSIDFYYVFYLYLHCFRRYN